MSNSSNKRNQIARSILFLGVMITLLFIGFLVNSKERAVLHHHVPSSVTFATKINNRELIKRVVFDILFMREKFEIKPREKTDLPETGIRIDKEIIFFLDKHEDNVFSSFLLHVANEHNFREFVENNKQVVGAVNNGIGCVVVLPDKDTSMQYFQKFAQDATIRNTDRTKTRINFSATNINALFHVFWEGNQSDFVQDISLEAFVEKNKIIFDGVGVKNPTIDLDTNSRFYIEQNATNRDFLELRTSSLPDTINQYLQKIVRQIGLKIPEIHSEQMFLYGIDIAEYQNRTVFIPQFDGVFRFLDTIKVEDLTNTDTIEKPREENEMQSISIGGKNFFVKKLSENELYIGRNDNPIFYQKTISNIVYANGNPSVLLNLSGNSFFAQLAQVLPPVQNTRQFLDSFEKFIWTSEVEENGKVKINGHIEFREKSAASMEIIRFLTKFS